MARNTKSWSKRLRSLARALSKAGIRWRIGESRTIVIPYHDGTYWYHALTRKQHIEEYKIRVTLGTLPWNVHIKYKNRVFRFWWGQGDDYFDDIPEAIKYLKDYMKRHGMYQGKGGYLAKPKGFSM